jgi:hypothetical protein
MTVLPTELRQNLYQLLDQIIATGEPLLVRRGDHTLRVTLVEDAPPALRCPPLRPDLVVGDLDDLVHIDWSSGWAAGKDL